MQTLGKSNGQTKDILIATRVTPRIDSLVKQIAYREGLYVSEWIRKIIIQELSRNNMLHQTMYSPSRE